MAPTATNFSPSASRPGPDRTLIVRRISFVAEAPDGAVARREFAHPRRMVAVEVPDEPAEFPVARTGDPTDLLLVATTLSDPDGSSADRAKSWMARADRPRSAPTLSIGLKSGPNVEWRPGRAIIRGAAEDTDELLLALIDFAYFEGVLRSLEEVVESQEPQALDDVRRAHRVSKLDRGHWKRIGETIERLAEARLIYARLEPMFAKPSRSLSPAGRNLMRRLSAGADISSRLASLTGRLEALEDLYEGANDRIADFRGWDDGHVLEIIIVVLLILEILLMAGDMSFHYLEITQEKSAVKAEAPKAQRQLDGVPRPSLYIQ